MFELAVTFVRSVKIAANEEGLKEVYKMGSLKTGRLLKKMQPKR